MNSTIVVILINIIIWASLIGMIINTQIDFLINWTFGFLIVIGVLGGTAIGCKIFYHFSNKKDLKKVINERKKIYNSNGQVISIIKEECKI